ncbi:hypothetical protein HD599_000802 [Conyzicola lurida]|uniref:Uncharacterized protein n=1 Tax=Conyzicola lurida TaxID=1172621 RepID=A0A841AM28_9MICO|nr:hypothetical protein [Conyzicola lurida]
MVVDTWADDAFPAVSRARARRLTVAATSIDSSGVYVAPWRPHSCAEIAGHAASASVR